VIKRESFKYSFLWNIFMTEKSNRVQVIESDGRTEIVVPHLDRTISFFPPYKRLESYVEMASMLKNDRLHFPTMSQNVSLFYSAFSTETPYYEINERLWRDKKYGDEILSCFSRLGPNMSGGSSILCATGVLYSKKHNGVFVQDRPKIEDGKVNLSETELENSLGSREEERVVYSNDGNVRFTPFGYKIVHICLVDWKGRFVNKEDKVLERHPFIIAIAGKEGAKKLDEISTLLYWRPIVYSLNKVEDSLTFATSLSLSPSQNYGGNCLEINGGSPFVKKPPKGCIDDFGASFRHVYGVSE
jgi:hypothetical protein